MTARSFAAGCERFAFALLVRVYPRDFRAEFAAQMTDVFAHMRADTPRGVLARAGLWLRILTDTLQAAPREWLYARRARAAHSSGPRADYAGATVAFVGVFLLYWITLAPTAAFWDAGEYITAAHVLGIPHPPGNPLFVLIARAWQLLLMPTSWPVAVRINALSAACSALAHFFLYLSIECSLRNVDRTTRRVSAACAVIMSATAFTVWNQSNVNEKVYTISFATVMATVWLALRWRDTRAPRTLIFAAYMTALTAANHLMGVLVVPAVLLFIWRVDRRVLFAPRMWAATMPAIALALSAQFYLPIRAAQRPLVNESDPTCTSLSSAAVSIYSNGAYGCRALSATLRREQYGKPSLLVDPTQPDQPRAAALIASQFVNYAQYLDWQWARSVAGTKPLFGGARPLITLCLLLLLAAGARRQWRSDRHATLLHAALLLTLSAGLVLYLNFRYGYTILVDRYPQSEMHEVRERDYFFLISFSLVGAWAGLGIAEVWRALAGRAGRVARLHTRGAQHAAWPRLIAAPVLALAFVPLMLNWSWASRADDWTARDWAYNVLMSVEPYGVLVTNGDNDSFPLWYLQHVERVREDVTIVVSPYLGTDWYARQLRDLSRPCPAGIDAADSPTTIACQRTFRTDTVHPRLLAAWGGAPHAPPEDSILPLSDEEIERIATDVFMTDRALQLQFGALTGNVAAGTVITPVDTFVAAMLQHSYGRRPIHFMAPSPIADRLGLLEHTVRVGLTWKLIDRARDTGLLELPPSMPARSFGRYIDIALTDTLSEDVFIVRGRVTDPTLPWADHASVSIPVQYSVMHYTAAVAHEFASDTVALKRHIDRMNMWQRVIGGDRVD